MKDKEKLLNDLKKLTGGMSPEIAEKNKHLLGLIKVFEPFVRPIWKKQRKINNHDTNITLLKNNIVVFEFRNESELKEFLDPLTK